jgi:hypothetical protein
MGDAPSRQELEAAHCWESDDRVPGRPAMTGFRRRLRYHQARWREANGHPIGTQPIVPRPGKPARPLGSRLPLDYAQETGPTSSPRAPWRRPGPGPRSPKRTRASTTSGSGPTCCGRRRWRPDAPGRARPRGRGPLRHSPGRFDPSYLNSLRAFDAALVLDLDDGTRGIVASTSTTTSGPSPRRPSRATTRGTWRSPSGRGRSPRGRPTPSRAGRDWP